MAEMNGFAAPALILLLSFALQAPGQTNPASIEALDAKVKALQESLAFLEQNLTRRVDDLLWFKRLEDVAVIDKIRYTGPPPHITNNPTAQGAGNPVIITAYTFLPRKLSPNRKLPLLVYVHGGVHGRMNSDEQAHLIREMIEAGYAVIAPEYRGSEGYGREFWEQIDYGGAEIEDVFEAKKWMLAHHKNIDPERVGILGWSHGGMITLLNVLLHPHEFKAAYAGVPVTDLVARMGYKGPGYAQLFSARYHIGKTAEENVQEYRRRSPVTHAAKLETPLLLHGATNDEDVNILEVEAFINALKAAGKEFEYKIYTNAPGGHRFNRLDTSSARQSRREVYDFLAKYLHPAPQQ